MDNVQRDIERRFQTLSREDQEDYIRFVEAMAKALPGDVITVGECMFRKNTDGTLDAIVGKHLLDAYNERFPEQPLKGVVL